MQAMVQSRLALERDLRQALEREEFVLHFQPQVRMDGGQLAGVEALIRWQHPTRGLLRPEAFIGVAEQLRLMLPIGEWVLREAARCARRWHQSRLAAVPVAVNLSSMQFRLEGFAASVARILAEEGVPGEWLELEGALLSWLPGWGEIGRIAIRTIGLVVFWLLFLGAYAGITAVMSALAGGRPGGPRRCRSGC